MYTPRDVSGLRVGARYVSPGWALFDHRKLMEEIASQLQWEEHDVDRKEAFFKRLDVDYRYGPGRPVRPYYPQPEPPALKALWAQVERFLRFEVEACFINYYLNHEGNIGWHSDNSPTMDHSKPLTLLSLGDSRVLCVRPIGETEFQEVVWLEGGSLFIMYPHQQFTHQHCSPRTLNPGGPRMSLVFRPLLRS